MTSAKWNWILLTIVACQLIFTSTADTHCSLNDDSTSIQKQSVQVVLMRYLTAPQDREHVEGVLMEIFQEKI